MILLLILVPRLHSKQSAKKQFNFVQRSEVMKPIIYLDMDGVLTDFNRHAFELFGPEWKTELELPNWGRFANHPNLYSRLKPMSDAEQLLDGCLMFMKGDINRIQVLTALPRRAHAQFPDAARHKTEWCKKFIHPN